MSLISLGMGFISYVVSIWLSFPISYILYNLIQNVKIKDTIYIIILGTIQFLLLFFFFRIKRFKNLFSTINVEFTHNIGVFISLITLTLISLIHYTDININVILMSLLLIMFGILLVALIKNYISNKYIREVNKRNIEILETTVSNQNQIISKLSSDNSKLSKIIHRDNKMIPAMELAVEEILKCESTDEQKEKAQNLLGMLKSMSSERTGIITEYENSNKLLPKTGIASVDASLKYLSLRAKNEDIEFDVSVITDFGEITDGIISETDLNTLILDLGENAAIAAARKEVRSILITFGMENEHYCFSVFDSGDKFDSEVIKNIGRKKITTRKESGGSGIGLYTAFEILKRYKASFILDETIDNDIFVKKISILFDGCERCVIRNE